MTEIAQLEKMRLEILEDIEDTSMDKIFLSKLEDAKFKYLELVYPYEPEVTELPNDRAKNWQTKCAIELYNKMGDENIKSRSENGLSESYDRAGISQDLLNELPPARAGVPR